MLPRIVLAYSSPNKVRFICPNSTLFGGGVYMSRHVILGAGVDALPGAGVDLSDDAYHEIA